MFAIFGFLMLAIVTVGISTQAHAATTVLYTFGPKTPYLSPPWDKLNADFGFLGHAFDSIPKATFGTVDSNAILAGSSTGINWNAVTSAMNNYSQA
jgi:hypothetical protein